MKKSLQAQANNITQNLLQTLGANSELSLKQREQSQTIAAQFIKIAVDLLKQEACGSAAEKTLVLQLFSAGLLKATLLGIDIFPSDKEYKDALQNIALDLFDKSKALTKDIQHGNPASETHLTKIRQTAAQLLLNTWKKMPPSPPKRITSKKTSKYPQALMLHPAALWEKLLEHLQKSKKALKATDPKLKAKQLDELPTSPKKMYEKLGVDPIWLQVGSNLLELVDPEQNGPLVNRLGALRVRLTDELGYVIPYVRVLDNLKLEPNTYSLSVRHQQITQGRIFPEHYMLADTDFMKAGLIPPINAIQDRNPCNAQEVVYWLPAISIPESLQSKACSAIDVLIEHLHELFIRQVDTILTYKDTLKLLEMVRQHCSTLADDLYAQLSLHDTRRVCANLIRESFHSGYRVCFRKVG